MNKIIQKYWPYFLTIAGWLIVIYCIASCTTTKYVPVETTKYINHTDTLHTHDTLKTTVSTIIREVDSAAMAELGITMKSQQRAWLIEKSQLQKQISSASHITHDTIHDSIPVIQTISETKVVEAKQAWYQRILQLLGVIFLIVIAIFSVAKWVAKRSQK